MAEQILSTERLYELVHYNAETGVFTRKLRTAQRHHVGDRADFIVTSGGLRGYYRIGIDSERYLAHRVAWLYVHKEWPVNQIDHIDGDPSNNRIANLRDVSDGVNKQNVRRARRGSVTGFLGVYIVNGRYRARVHLNGSTIYARSFDTPEEAHSAYLKAKRILHEGCTI